MYLVSGECLEDEVEERAYEPCRLFRGQDRAGQGRAKGKGWAAQGWALLKQHQGEQESKSGRRGGGRGGEERRREAARQGGNKTKIPQPNPVQPCRSN